MNQHTVITHKNNIASIHGGGTVCAIGYLLLSLNSHWHWWQQPLWLLLSILTINWCILFACYYGAKHHKITLNTRQLLFWATVFVIIGYSAHPILENDYFRYLWDGFQFATQGTPYAKPPAAAFANEHLPIVFQQILDHVAYPNMLTIYGPASQVLFLIAYFIKAGSLYSLKFLLSLFTLLSFWLATKTFRQPETLLFCWSPLIIFEGAFNAHIDVLGAFFVLLAIYAWCKHYPWLLSTALALASGVKILALVLIPFLLSHRRVKFWGFCLALVVLIYLPFIFTHNANIISGLSMFAKSWEYHSLLFALLKQVLPNHLAKYGVTVLILIFLGGYYYYYTRYSQASHLPRGDFILIVVFLLSPVFNPWYTLWLLPFAAYYPSRFAWGLIALISLSYINGYNLPELNLPLYHHPAWLKPLEAAVLVALLLWDWITGYKRLQQPSERNY